MNNYIDLNIKELYLYCCDNREVFLDNMIYLKNEYNRKIHNYTAYTPYSIYHFMHNLRCSIDNDRLISNVRICSDDLLNGICKLLEIDNSNLDEEKTIELIRVNINNLKNIKDRSLRDKFPKLYFIFQQALGMYDKWKVIDSLDENKQSEKKLYNNLNKIKKEYFSYGFRYSYAKFTEVQAEYIERLINNKERIENYCNNNKKINDIYFIGLNKNKLNLYLFYNYIEKIKNCNDNKLRCELLNILSNNLYKIIDLDDSIVIFKDINKTSLLAEYTILNRKYGIPKSLSINGAILPSSKDYNKRGNGNIKARIYKPLTEGEREELIRINRQKKDFYNNSGYLTVISEKDNLTGNSAFVYPNGHIIEDYIADENNDSSLKNNKRNAAYHVDIYNFERFIDMGKMEVKRDKDCHGTFNHSGDWVGKLQMIVDIKSTDQVFDDTRQFIKRMEDKKKSL